MVLLLSGAVIFSSCNGNVEKTEEEEIIDKMEEMEEELPVEEESYIDIQHEVLSEWEEIVEELESLKEDADAAHQETIENGIVFINKSIESIESELNTLHYATQEEIDAASEKIDEQLKAMEEYYQSLTAVIKRD